MIIPGTVIRGRSEPTGTPGEMTFPAVKFSCDSQELPWHDNERGRSCIHAGVYRGWVWWSPMLRRPVIRLEDRFGRADCLVHNGNFAADERDLDGDGVPEITQVHGCTEVGRGYGNILRKDGKTQWGIKSSGPTLDALIKALENGEPHEVAASGRISGYHEVLMAYEWGAGCAPDGYVAPGAA